MTLNFTDIKISANDYYPFGEVIPGRSVNNSSDVKKYWFTGKERDDQTNYDYFGARYYDSETGRWTTTDPLKDKYAGWSSYNYCMNEPLMRFDPDGKESYKPNEAEKKLILRHPINAYKVNNNAEIAKKTAIIKYGDDGLHNGDGDAFRHAFWQAMNTRDVGPASTLDFANAHETTPGQPAIEKSMDDNNNQVGLSVGLNNPKATDEQLMKIVEEKVKSGELSIIKDGKLVPSGKSKKKEEKKSKEEKNK